MESYCGIECGTVSASWKSKSYHKHKVLFEVPESTVQVETYVKPMKGSHKLLFKSASRYKPHSNCRIVNSHPNQSLRNWFTITPLKEWTAQITSKEGYALTKQLEDIPQLWRKTRTSTHTWQESMVSYLKTGD